MIKGIFYMIRFLILFYSSFSFAGICDFPWQKDSTGQRCDERAAVLKPKGRLGHFDKKLVEQAEAIKTTVIDPMETRINKKLDDLKKECITIKGRLDKIEKNQASLIKGQTKLKTGQKKLETGFNNRLDKLKDKIEGNKLTPEQAKALMEVYRGGK